MATKGRKQIPGKKYSVKVKHMVMVLFFALGVLPFLGGYFGISQYYAGQMEKLLKNDLAVAAKTLSKQIDHFYQERDADFTVIASYDVTKKLLEESNLGRGSKAEHEREHLNNMLTVQVEANEFIESATLLNKNFQIVACSKSCQYGELSILKDAKNFEFSTATVFSDLIKNGEWGTESRGVAAIKMLVDEEGDTSGYLVEEINLSFFEDLRHSVALYQNGTIYLLDSSGNLLTGGDSNTDRDDFVSAEKDRQAYYEAWEGRDKNKDYGTLVYEMGSDQYLTYYCGFQNVKWRLLTTFNVTKLLNTRERMQQLSLLAFGIVAFMFFLLHLIFDIQIGKPMKEITSKLNLIRERQDYGIRIEYQKQNEIGFIAEKFNEFLSYIEGHIRMEQEKAERDALTGLYHKQAIRRIAEEALKKAREEKHPMGLLFVDIDDFKAFNTVYGHLGGDKTLLFVSKVLMSLGHPTGRVGGDEFVVCLTEIPDEKDLMEAIQQVKDILQYGVMLRREEPLVSITCSIGAAISKTGQSSYETLLSCADEVMYEVKNSTKNSCRIKRCP